MATGKRGTKTPDWASGMRGHEPHPVTRLQIRQLPDPLTDRALQIPVSPARALRLEEQRGSISQLTPQVVDSIASLKRDCHRGRSGFGTTGGLDSPALEAKRSEISSDTTTVQAPALVGLATARTSGLTDCHGFPPTLTVPAFLRNMRACDTKCKAILERFD